MPASAVEPQLAPKHLRSLCELITPKVLADLVGWGEKSEIAVKMVAAFLGGALNHFWDPATAQLCPLF